MDNEERKKREKELREAVIKGFKKVIASLKQEPSQVIVSGDENSPGCQVNEITSWLFRRRHDNGRDV